MQPIASSPTFRLQADSIDAVLPGQRLEMVVSQPPLVASLAPREVIENRDSANVVRGALELRPQ